MIQYFTESIFLKKWYGQTMQNKKKILKIYIEKVGSYRAMLASKAVKINWVA
jgi:hypothetical protein